MNVLKKILIVEDDQLLNRTLAYNLTSDGYEVISVFNFDSAVRKLRENEFDVALLDINLPDGSGLDPVSYTHLKILYCNCPSEMRETLLRHTQETAKELTELSKKFETN